MAGAPVEPPLQDGAVLGEFLLGRVGVGLAAGGEAEPLAPGAGKLHHGGEGFALAQFACRQAILAHDDLVARPELCAVQHARLFQRDRVGPHRVVVGSGHREGLVRDDPVEVVARHGLVFRQDRVVGAGSDDQGQVAPRRREFLDRLAHRLEPVQAEEVQVLELRRAAEEVHMRLDEAGQHRVPVRIEHLRIRAAQPLDLGAAAHREDVAAGDGDRLGGRPVRVHGEEPAVGDDRVCECGHVSSLSRAGYHFPFTPGQPSGGPARGSCGGPVRPGRLGATKGRPD